MTGHAGERVVSGIKASILGALILDGFLCAVIAVLFLPLYVGSTPVPASGVLAGIVNVLLVRVAFTLSHSVSRAALPVAGFFVGLVLTMLGGPGGDVLIAADWRTLVVVAGGLLPPVVQLFSLRFVQFAELNPTRH
ncbi:MAG: hypothetical protein WBF79_05345 [Rhodococcus sp. (in: high G+C Gram-positive bacteria)]